MQPSNTVSAKTTPRTFTPAETHGSPRRGRYTEVDVFRGIAVIGVVFAHTAQGLAASGVISVDSTLFTINAWMLQFRMPAIALVIGLFIPSGLAKYGAKGYVRRRVIFATYLYALWYVLQMSFEVAASSVKNHPLTMRDVLVFWETDSQLWFIPYIAVSAVILALVKPWERIPPISLGLLVGLSVAVWGWQTDVVGLRGLCLLGFTALGSVIGIERFGRWLQGEAVIVVLVGVTAGLVSLQFMGEALVPTSAPAKSDLWRAGHMTWLPQSVLVACLGLMLLAALAVLITRIPGLGLMMKYVGTQTLPIYLAHVLLVATTRILLIRAGVTAGEVLLPLLVSIGVFGPLVMSYVSRRTKVTWIFDVPKAWLPKRLA